jgi:hypothetical protein
MTRFEEHTSLRRGGLLPLHQPVLRHHPSCQCTPLEALSLDQILTIFRLFLTRRGQQGLWLVQGNSRCLGSSNTDALWGRVIGGSDKAYELGEAVFEPTQLADFTVHGVFEL